jgi:hypothetical protein
MRTNGIKAMLLAVLLGLTSATSSHALTQAEEAFFSVLATGVNIFYVPAKFLVAAAAIPVGGLAGAFSGGDSRTAYAIWVPAMGGTYFITNGHLDGSKPIEFFGYDYDDKLAPVQHGEDRTMIYDTPYSELYR